MVSTYECRAAYLYVLRLDRRQIVEEFLKRNLLTGIAAGPRRVAAEPPDRHENVASTVALMQSLDRDQRAIDDRSRFDLWRIGGDKELHHLGARLALTVRRIRENLYVELPIEIAHGAPVVFSIACGRQFRIAAQMAARVNAALSESAVRMAAAWRPGAQQMLFMRALIALDGHLRGASYRQIAVAIFGTHAVRNRWRADLTLKAQIRYLVTKGRHLMNEARAHD